MIRRAVLALDLGATSGRVIRASVGDDALELETVARFENRPVARGERLYWDVLRLWSDAMEGIRAAAREGDVASVGVDAWGVDYGLMRAGELLSNPRHYRDARGRRGQDIIHSRMSPPELYSRNGNQQLPINTIYQLATEGDDGMAGIADGLLMIPELFAFWLSGTAVAERTSASTSGLFDPRRGVWDETLGRLAGIDTGLLAPLVDAGDGIGVNRDEIARDIGRFDVIAVGSHDTASAIAAVPMDPRSAVFISCGTWGLVGVELAAPIVTDRTFTEGFTNERGVDGTSSLMRNVMGLWLLSESLRWWALHGSEYIVEEVVRAAGSLSVSPFVFDVDDPEFATPGDIPGRIHEWFRARRLPQPDGDIAVVRCILDSLAQAFADAAAAAADLAGIDATVIHVVGGGSLNTVLCQEIANRTRLPVHAGPVEATAMGNVLVQGRAVGMISGSLEELRDVVRRTQRVSSYFPTR